MAGRRYIINAKELVRKGTKKYDEGSLRFETETFLDRFLGRPLMTGELDRRPAYGSKEIAAAALRAYRRGLREWLK